VQLSIDALKTQAARDSQDDDLDSMLRDPHEVSLVILPVKLEGVANNPDERDEAESSAATRAAFFHWSSRGVDGRVLDLKHSKLVAGSTHDDQDVRLKAYFNDGHRRYAKHIEQELHGHVVFQNTGLIYRRAKKKEQDRIPPMLVRATAIIQAACLPPGSGNHQIDILPQIQMNRCIICGDDNNVMICCVCLLATHPSCSRDKLLSAVDSVPKQQHTLLPSQLRLQTLGSRTHGDHNSVRFFFGAL